MVQLIKSWPKLVAKVQILCNLERRLVCINLDLQYIRSIFLKEVKYKLWFVSFCQPILDFIWVTRCLTMQVHQTQWKEGPPHLHRVPGLPPGALPWPHGERSREEGRIRLPPGLRSLSGTLQNALQTNLAPLERACQVMLSFTPESAANCLPAERECERDFVSGRLPKHFVRKYKCGHGGVL